jgi:hypothetical protein
MAKLVGVVFVLAGVGFGLVWPYVLGQESSLLTGATAIGSESVIDEVVVAQGSIDPEQEIVNESLVLGSIQAEYEDSDGDLTWKTVADFGARIRMRTEAGVEVEVEVGDSEPRGNYRTYNLGNDRRVIGFAPGDEWLAVGTVSSVRPYELEAIYHFGGDREAYSNHLLLYRWLLRLVGLVLCGFGVFTLRDARNKA